MKSSWIGIFGAFAMALPASAQAVQVAPSPGSEMLELETLTPGTCLKSDGTHVDMRLAVFGENEEVDILQGSTRRRLRVDNAGVYFWAGDHYYPAYMLISGAKGGDLDLNLKIVALDGEVFFYWRETYKHRSFRQGLLRIVGDNIVPFCEGMGENPIVEY